MKWMIASDLHGSAYYCKKMVEAFEREGADRLLMLGALLGFLIVYIADEKKLHFDVRAPFWGQVLKLVLGLALIVGIKAGLKPLLVSLFAGSQAESFVRYFLLVLFAGIVWPLTFPFFAKLGRKGNAA